MLLLIILISGTISVVSFATVTGTPVEIASANFSLPISMSTGIAKKMLKTTRNKKKKHNKIVMLTKTKLNSIESKISEGLINNEISNEDFTTIINEEKNYRELIKSIRMMKTQKKWYWEKDLIEEGKRKDIDEIVRQPA